LGQAIAIVVAVMVLFLGLRTGLVVATLIPTTIITSFYLMEIFSITINQISLAALIIALGLLVDNAIVMVESILVKREQGVGAFDAAIQSGNELKAPLLVSSLTTAAAFMPIGLAESAVGEYTADIFYVVAIALLASWCLAMTVLPMLATIALKISKKPESNEQHAGRWYQLYSQLLRWCIGHRVVFGVAVIAIFFAAVKGLGFVRSEFIAPSEDPIFTAKLEMPVGTDITASAAEIAKIDAFIRDRFYAPDEGDTVVKNWLVFTGEGGPRFMLSLDPPNVNPANSFLIVNTVSHAVTERVLRELRAYLFESHPDLDSQVARLENGPPVGYPIQIRLSAGSIDGLYETADQVTGLLFDSTGVSAVKNSWGMKSKKLLVEVDQERARRAGVSSEDVAFSLNASLSGIDLTEYREGDDLIPVQLRTEISDRQDISKLDGMSVYGQSSGKSVPLKQVADIVLAFEPGMIARRDRVKTLTLSAQLRNGFTATTVNEEFLPKLDQLSQTWPRGTRYELGGESESSGDANASIAAKLPLAFMVILLLLVMQFDSLRRPLIVLTTIPLGLIGVTFGLLAVDSAFGFFTILGIISLSGIIINNAIVLLDRIAIEHEEPDTSHFDAVIRACQLRLRPIMLTTATTVLGMLPLLWGGSAMFRPMAVTIIFGLIFATLLTLLVVPVLYAALFKVSMPSTPVSEPAT
ncbi:MAG: efflux RND transporter permease subunit, partial [Pseudomonadota bacterium]